MSMKVDLEQRPELMRAVELVQAGAPIQLDQCGEPAAAVLSPEQWEQYGRYTLQRAREAVLETWALNAGADPDEVEREVAAALAEVRSERAVHHR